MTEVVREVLAIIKWLLIIALVLICWAGAIYVGIGFGAGCDWSKLNQLIISWMA